MNGTTKREAAWAALKSLVYGGGNIGPDGKDDGGHRCLKGQILFDHWEVIRASLATPAVPDGWVMVPRKPTDEMLIAAYGPGGTDKYYKDLYDLMLSAAPKQNDQGE